jgi:hypothetical protein
VGSGSTDSSLFFSLATAIATAITAAVKLGLLDVKRDAKAHGAEANRSFALRRAASAVTLCAAILGILAALIAIGNGNSQRLLTILMFVGIVAPAAYTLWATLHNLLGLSGVQLVTALVGVATAAVVLLLVTSPQLWRSVVSPNAIRDERRTAEKLAGKPWPPGRKMYECDTEKFCYIPKVREPRLNAFTNSTVGGDESYFTSASLVPRNILETTATASTLRVNVLEVQQGDEVRVTVFYRNGGCLLLQDSETKKYSCEVRDRSTRNASVALLIPKKEAAGQVVVGVIHADNARPKTIADPVAFVSDERFHLRMIPESARLFNGYSGGKTLNGSTAQGTGLRLPNTIVTEVAGSHADPSQFTPSMGGRIGYNKLDGVLVPGIGQWGLVQVRLRVV